MLRLRLIRLLKNDLAREISNWVEKGLITPDQAESICHLYGIDYHSIANRSTGYRLLLSLGYLFIGVAVIILLGANWDEIPRGLRMAGLLVLTVGTQGFALKTYFEKKESNATGLFLLGNLFYGASIILIAQIYHLGEHMPDGVFWWALGSLPFGVLLRNTWLTLFSCLLALIWFFMEYSVGFTAPLFPLFIVAAVYVLIKGPPSTLLFLTAVVSIGVWIEVSLAAVWTSGRTALDLHAEHVFVTAALFVFAYAFSQWLYTRGSSKAKDYSAVLSVWALRFGLVVMLVLSFDDPWFDLLAAIWDHLASMLLIVFVLIGASLWLGWLTGKLSVLIPICAFIGVSLTALLLSDYPGNAIYFQFAYNIALVGFAISLIMRGIDSGISHYFFLGVATILLIALFRYFDLIGEYVGGAMLFLILAALLLAAARYWKTRKIVKADS